jgi:DNA-3-methyladenine glycosylase I
LKGKEVKRCGWANHHELLTSYHDEEWGVPVHEDRLLFELLNLEGAQAGLSWLTILKKRQGYRKLFDHFDVKKIAKYDDKKKAALLKDDRIVRHSLKINAVVENAKACLRIQKEYGSFAKYIWQFVDGKSSLGYGHNQPNEASFALSKDLKKRGFRFVGVTTCFAFMQAVGLVNDHSPDCFRFKPCQGAKTKSLISN